MQNLKGKIKKNIFNFQIFTPVIRQGKITNFQSNTNFPIFNKFSNELIFNPEQINLLKKLILKHILLYLFFPYFEKLIKKLSLAILCIILFTSW